MGHVMSDAEWFLVMSEEYEESEEKKIAKMKFSLLVPLFKYHKIVNRIGIFHVNLSFVGLTLVP